MEFQNFSEEELLPESFRLALEDNRYITEVELRLGRKDIMWREIVDELRFYGFGTEKTHRRYRLFYAPDCMLSRSSLIEIDLGRYSNGRCPVRLDGIDAKKLTPNQLVERVFEKAGKNKIA